jgi:hypothetical protein
MKTKTCKSEGCKNPAFSKGFCKWHQNQRTDEKYLLSKKISEGNINKVKTASKIVKKYRNGISPISEKRLAEMEVYRKNRDVYMASHPKCEVGGCNKKSKDLHHKRGRVGDDYTNPANFMAVCRKCHIVIENNPQWAKDNGYSITRTNNLNNE